MKDDTILEAFDEVISDLRNKGHKPKFNVTDNQAAKPINEYLAKEDGKWQFVEPSNHRVNVAERAIQMFKSHFIRGLCCTDNTWPLQLWDQITTQAVITCNILRTPRIDPSKLSYHEIHGKRYDWNKCPMAHGTTRI